MGGASVFRLALSFVFVFLLSSGTDGRSLPKFINRCKKHDPEMSKCLSKAVEALQPLLKDGIPEMHIPPIEPLTLQSVTFDTGKAFKAYFTNVLVHRLSEFKLNNVAFDFDKKELEIKIDFYNVYAEADYKIDGKLLFLELNGAGRSNGSVEHVGATAKLHGIVKNIKGKDYFNFDSIDLDLALEGGFLYLENVIKNNPEISAQTNKIIAENVDNIFNELKPVIKNSFEQVILLLAENVIERFSIDELFRDD